MGGIGFRQQHPVHHLVVKDQMAIPGKIDIDDLDVGFLPADVILAGKRAADGAVAALIVDGVDPQGRLVLVVDQMEQPPVPDQARAQELADERSEEHTSELQSLMRISYAVFCLKKKKHYTTNQQQRGTPQ